MKASDGGVRSTTASNASAASPLLPPPSWAVAVRVIIVPGGEAIGTVKPNCRETGEAAANDCRSVKKSAAFSSIAVTPLSSTAVTVAITVSPGSASVAAREMEAVGGTVSRIRRLTAWVARLPAVS